MIDPREFAMLDAGANQYLTSLSKQQPQQKRKSGRGGTLTSLISEGGAVGGGAAGAALGTAVLPGIGTLVGGALGAGLGAFSGRLAENKIRDDRYGLSDATKEGVLSAVLGGGPLRLAKTAVTAGKAVRGGASLAEALKQGGEAGVNMSLRRTVGGKLTNASDDLLVKQFRLTPTQLKDFKKKFGEDASATIKQYGFRNAEDVVKKGLEPLQGQYDDLVAGISKPISFDEFAKSVEKRAQKLINSAASDTQKRGLDLLDQLNALKLNYGKDGFKDGAALNKVKKDYDALVNYTEKQANPNKYSVNKHIADAARETLNKQSPTLEKTGRELSKLHQLGDNALKQEQLGRGNLPIGLGNTPGAVVGSSVGPLGAFAGYLGNALINSPAGRRAVAGTADKLGSRLAKDAEVGKPFSLGQTASRVLPASGLGAALSGQSDLTNNMTSANPIMTSASTPSAANMSELSQPNVNMSTSPFASENLQSSIEQILANGGTLKDAAEFVSLATALQKVQSTSQKPMSAEAAKVTSNAELGLQALGDFENTIAQNPSALRNSVIPGRTLAGGLLGRALGTQQLDAARQQVVDVIARLRTGAAITNEEANRFMQFLPTAADTPDVQTQKIGYLRQQFADILQRTGSASTSLEDALMTQGAY